MRFCSLAAFTVVSLSSAVAAANPIVIDLLPGPTSHEALGITAGKTTAFVVTTEPGAGTDRLYRTNGRADGTALIETMNATAFGGGDTSLIGVSSKGVYFIDPDKELTFHSGYKGGRATLGAARYDKGELVGELSNGKAVLRLVGYSVYDAVWVTDGTEKGSSSIDLGPENGRHRRDPRWVRLRSEGRADQARRRRTYRRDDEDDVVHVARQPEAYPEAHRLVRRQAVPLAVGWLRRRRGTLRLRRHEPAERPLRRDRLQSEDVPMRGLEAVLRRHHDRER